MYSSEASQQLFFDPDKHPEDTLKAFQEFIQTFELRYHAQYPDPPKVSLDSAVERWKVANTTESNPQPINQHWTNTTKSWGCFRRGDFTRIGRWLNQMNQSEIRKNGRRL
jgi:hypothetical protein